MTEISFTIRGNHKDKNGNPLPKLRMTRGQSWRPEVREYMRWKEHIQIAYIEALNLTDKEAGRDAARNIAAFKKPLVLGNRSARMHIQIAWKDGHHGDPENIFGSIADALFHNDKELYGSFEPLDDEGITSGEGQVRCIIRVSDPLPKKETRKRRKPLQTISE